MIASLACVAVLLPAQLLAAEPVSGWRGNMTGLWPDSKPPLEWHCIPRGALDDMRFSATPPKAKDAGDAVPVVKGLVRDWLIIGPFPVADSVKDLDNDLLADLTLEAA